MRERPVADAASEELSRRTKKIHKQGRHLAKLDAQHLHKLRIRVKKLRYATEFFAGAFPSTKKSARRRTKFVVKLKAMQDALGDINDIRVHQGLVKQTIKSQGARIQHDRRARRAFAAGRLSGREAARFASVMKEAERAYAAFAKAGSFWP
jgi:triphosphatase